MAKKIRRPYIINGTQCWISGNSEQEVLENAIRLMGLSPAPAKPGTNFGQYAWNWFETYSRPNVETVTAVTYERQLRNHIVPALGSTDIGDITLDDVQAMFNRMEGARETKNKCKVVLNMIFKRAVEDGLMTRNLLESSSFRLKGKTSRETEPYTVEEMRCIVGGIDKLKNPVDRAYLALHALHPLRLEEVLGLRWGDLDAAHMKLHIRRVVPHPTRNAPEVKETKTGATHSIGLSAVSLQHLTSIGPGSPDEYIVGGKAPLSYTQVVKMRKRIAREIGFSGTITPMRFRATVLTGIYEQTGDIKLTQQAAGHATPQMTLKHYVKGRRSSADAAQAIDHIYAATGG